RAVPDHLEVEVDGIEIEADPAVHAPFRRAKRARRLDRNGRAGRLCLEIVDEEEFEAEADRARSVAGTDEVGHRDAIVDLADDAGEFQPGAVEEALQIAL